MEILLTRDYLWDIIDNFIYLNHDKSLEYYTAIHTIYEDTLKTYTKVNNSKLNLGYLEVVTVGITIIRIIDMMNSYYKFTQAVNASYKYIINIEKLVELRKFKSDEVLQKVTLLKEEMISQYNRYAFAKIHGNFANIHLLLFAFKEKIFVTKEFTKTFAENVAQYIQEQLLLGNCSQEFVDYLNTYLN